MATTHTLRLLTANGDVVQEVELRAGQSTRMQVSQMMLSHVAAIETLPVGDVDEFVLAHIDEIIGLAAAAMWWREEARAPHNFSTNPTEALRETAKSAAKYIRYGTILDTADAALRSYLLTKVPSTQVEVREGG